jgi:hypothetical protein
MSSVGELAARLDRRESDLNRVSCWDSDAEGAAPFSSTDDSSDNATNSSRAAPDSMLSKSRAPASNLEMIPLNQASIQSGTSSSTITSSAPLPPSQPARFLRNPAADNGSLTDSSMLNAASSDSVLSGLNSTNPHQPSGLAQMTSDGLPDVVEPNTVDPPIESQVRDRAPIPVKTLFARDAAPLYLPELDELLETLPRFEFTYAGHTKTGPPQPFPPFNLLHGQRLKDLIHNAQPTPLWRDWNSIGSTVGAYFLSS